MYMYTYNMPSPIHIYEYICSILYICKYWVCPHGPYDLLDFEIKLYLSICNGQVFYTNI